MQSSTIRRLVCGAALAGGIWLGLTACDGAARADDTPAAATDHPGGVVGTVVEVVDEAVPSAEPKPAKAVEAEPEPKPAEPEATAEPEPEPEPERTEESAPEPESKPSEEAAPADEPTTEPRRGTDEQDAPASEPTTEPRKPEPVVDLPPVDVPADVPPAIPTPPPPVPTPPAPSPPPVVAPPVVPPTPTPAAPSPDPEQHSYPLPVEDDAAGYTPAPAEAEQTPAPTPAAVDLPVVIGPIAATSSTATPQVDDGIYPPGTLPEPDTHAAGCDDRSDQADSEPAYHSRGDGKQQRDEPGVGDAGTPRPATPCPAPARPDGQNAAAAGVKPPPPTGEQLIAATLGGAYSRPVLHRLTQLRARSHTLAGRTEHPEPGPA